MKKLFAFLLVVVMILSMMVGCGNNTTPGNDTDTKKIETLKVAFVPSREPAEIITVTEPLKAMLDVYKRQFRTCTSPRSSALAMPVAETVVISCGRELIYRRYCGRRPIVALLISLVFIVFFPFLSIR